MVTDMFGELALTSARVLRPDDDGYDEARASFNGMIDRRPAVIVQPATTEDVAAAVRAARSAGLPIAIRGGGHSVSGQAFAQDALVVDLRRMRSVTVDPQRRLAFAEGGALWEDVDGATVPHRLYVPGGTFVDTGIRFAGFQSVRGTVQLQVNKTFTCDDGSGTFDIKMQIHANFDTGIESFTWVATGGTGAYSRLHGSGTGSTVPNPPIGNINTFAGFVLR